jgi:hypothetical protein
MTTGPFLYDDGPAALHTASPRRRRGLLFALFGGTVLIAVLMVLALPLVTGSPDTQARQAVGVFLQAMERGDTGTAHAMLCDKERARLTAAQTADAYAGPQPGRVVSATRDSRDGDTAELVRVRWADGTSSRITVVPEDGARVCGVSPGA